MLRDGEYPDRKKQISRRLLTTQSQNYEAPYNSWTQKNWIPGIIWIETWTSGNTFFLQMRKDIDLDTSMQVYKKLLMLADTRRLCRNLYHSICCRESSTPCQCETSHPLTVKSTSRGTLKRGFRITSQFSGPEPHRKSLECPSEKAKRPSGRRKFRRPSRIAPGGRGQFFLVKYWKSGELYAHLLSN